jgi:hypothetical protein
MMGPFMCSPLGVSRRAEDVKPTNDDDPVTFQVKRFVQYFDVHGEPCRLFQRPVSELPVSSHVDDKVLTRLGVG